MNRSAHRRVLGAGLALAASLALAVTGCTKAPTSGPSATSGSGNTAAAASGPIKIGLVTKTESNPYFVKLRESAKAEASKNGATLIALAGKFDGDNEGQVTAIQNLVQQGVKGILITPSNATGILNAIKDAESKGIVVIALDTETTPSTAVAATYATDNYGAGKILGQYVKAKMGSTKPQLLTMDLDPSASVGQQRHNGFLAGMGLPQNTPDIIGSALTQGDQTKAQQAMENLLQRTKSKVNVVYNINEPAARGSYQALKDAGIADKVIVAAIDGSCSGVADVKDGHFVATVMQFPKKMAEDGVDAVVKFAKDGTKPSGFINTGSQLITDKPLSGIPSKDTSWGAANCWG